jgi:hypothetical protein
MTARQLERMSKNADKEEKAEKVKLKKVRAGGTGLC